MANDKTGRCLLLILDSVGAGALADAADYGDEGADTLGHICASRKLEIPNLEKLGLGCIRPLENVQAAAQPAACFGRMAEASAGKDSTTGHWELAGLVTEQPFRTFPNGFPADLLARFESATSLKVLGNKAASGTEIIRELGREHLRLGWPIVYTSADPVFQIAAHEEVIPVPRLYELCEAAYEIALPYGINRVIARPFTGTYPDFERTERRRDFSLPPPGPTVLDALGERGIPVVSVGKVNQMFADRGISESHASKNNRQGIERTMQVLKDLPRGLVFTNLIDFDMLYGHRRDVDGYARSLEELDADLPELMASLRPEDLYLIAADHGNDPTFRGTDHTRELVPLLAGGPRFAAGRDLGVRKTFADVAATIADFFAMPWEGPGTSFLPLLRP